MKRIFIGFNLIVVAVFAMAIYTMVVELKGHKISDRSLGKYEFVKILRPPVDISGEYNTLFDVKIIEAMLPDKGQEIKASGILNQLVSGSEIIRVRGIFIIEGQQSAVIETIKRDKIGKNVRGRDVPGKRQKVTTGDTIKEYTVRSIMPGSIVLSHPSLKDITLKIFAKQLEPGGY